SDLTCPTFTFFGCRCLFLSGHSHAYTDLSNPRNILVSRSFSDNRYYPGHIGPPAWPQRTEYDVMADYRYVIDIRSKIIRVAHIAGRRRIPPIPGFPSEEYLYQRGDSCRRGNYLSDFFVRINTRKALLSHQKGDIVLS